MKTIIHIGQHKTGTTSIQYYLRKVRARLARDGLYVPDVLVGFDSPSHYILNVYALNSNRFSSMKNNLLATRDEEFFNNLKINLEENIFEHYEKAKKLGCNEIIWSNEGLYLLNSIEEYQRIFDLFDRYSAEIVCVCCFRDVDSYRSSYMEQLRKQGITFTNVKDSFRYVEPDSWLFDYCSKERLLKSVFDKVVTFPYNAVNMVETFMHEIGYVANNGDVNRLNVTEFIAS